MRHIWIVFAILALGCMIGAINSDNNRHEKEMQQLKIKELELKLKLKQQKNEPVL